MSKVLVTVEESKKRIIENPEYLLNMDRLVMKDGTNLVVTMANQEEITLILSPPITIKKEDLPAFLQNLKHVIRADCFER